MGQIWAQHDKIRLAKRITTYSLSWDHQQHNIDFDMKLKFDQGKNVFSFLVQDLLVSPRAIILLSMLISSRGITMLMNPIANSNPPTWN